MVGKLQPLAKQFEIVDDQGRPTDYFIRWAQQRQIDIGEGITAAQALQIVEDYVDEWSADRDIIAGFGLDGGGPLSSDVTIDLNAGLGDLNDVDLVTTPPADGDSLTFDAATSTWIPGPGGGGGSVSYYSVFATGTGASQNVTLPVAPGAPNEILVFVNGIEFESDEYTVVGTTVTLTTNAAGDSIEIRGLNISGGGGGGGNWWFDPPTAASFTSQSGDANPILLTDDADCGLLVSGNPTQTGDVIRFGYRTLTNPSLDWSMVGRFEFEMTGSALFGCLGLMMLDPVGGRSVQLQFSSDGANRIDLAKATNLTTVSSRVGGVGTGAPTWLRIDKVGANVRYYASATGKLWRLISTESATAWMANAPARVGIFVNNRTGSPAMYAVQNFSLTGPAV